MARACALRNIPFILTSRAELDPTAPETVAAALDRIAPWAVVNAAGWVRVDEAETARDACLTANARGAVALAKACGDRGVASLSFSSDLVFDGKKGAPYVEDDPVAPRNCYGLSKAEMEEGIAALGAPHPSRSEEHTSELQSLMRTSYAVFCLKKKKKQQRATAIKLD